MKNNLLFFLLFFFKFNLSKLFPSNYGHIDNIINSNDKKNIFLLNNFISNHKDSKNNIKYIDDFIKNTILENENVTETCKQFLEINNITLPEIIENSCLGINELNYYEKCLDSNNNINYSFYIIVIDSSQRNYTEKESYFKITKTLLDYDKTYYLYGFCLPYQETNSNSNCNINDYKEIIIQLNKKFNSFLFPQNSKISLHSIIQNVENKALSLTIIFILIIIFIFISLNYIIFLLLKPIFIKEKKNEILNNNDSDYLDNKKYIIPNWLIRIHKCFSIKENIYELFDFNSNSTEMNKYSGINQIKGLHAISMAFTQLGLTFLVIYNSPLKINGISQMRNFIGKPAFILVFIGLRYSTRLIFSFSGYFLSFKYLSFIEKNFGIKAFIKFIMYQFHKFFMLILLHLFFRYSLNYLIIEFMPNVSPYWVFFQENIIKNYKERYKFFLSFLGIDLFFEDKNTKADQNLSDYLWISYNEIFFFIFSVIMISIGYKYKLKIDIFILILIFVILMGKIIFSCFYVKEYYSTLYYYTFDYGKFMINPLFNLSYFLIGMYFGFINFTLQNGISFIKIDTSIYRKIKDFTFKDNDVNSNNDNNNEINSINITTSFEYSNNNISQDRSSALNESSKNMDKSLYSSKNTIKKIPFLKSVIKYINYRKKHKLNIIFDIFAIIALIIPIASHVIMVLIYNFDKETNENYQKIINVKAIKNEKEKAIEEYYKDINLEKFISNNFLNFIFRIDIEIFVILIHWIFFMFQINGQGNILSFFKNIAWGIFSKCYFSFTIVSNMVTLFIIYSNVTLIPIKTFSIYLGFIFNLFVGLIFTFIVYIYLELPLKKFMKYLLNINLNREENENDNNINLKNNEEQEKQSINKKIF